MARRSQALVAQSAASFPRSDRAAADDRPNANLTTSVHDQLRADILAGRLRPTEKLRAEALRRRFGVGSSPIREALNRLLAEGLVALEDNKGFRVAPISQDELSELVKARGWIDGTAITESILLFDKTWEEGLILALYRLSRVVRGGADNTEWERLHKAFHAALVSGCGSRWIVRTSLQLFDAAERYRLLAADQVPERNEREEHEAIVDACLARDAAKAVELLRAHYGRTHDVIVQALLAPPARGASGASSPSSR